MKSPTSFEIMKEAKWLQHMDGDHANDDVFNYVPQAIKNLIK